MFKGIGTGSELWSADLTQWCDGGSLPNTANAAITTCPNDANFVPYQAGGILAGVWYDNAAASPATATATQLGNEAIAAAAHFGNTTVASNRYAYYVIMSPHGSNPDNYQGQYCAWHDWNGDVGSSSPYGDIAFSNQPYNMDSGAGCGVGFVHSGSAGNLDGWTMTLGHEWHEMMSDTNPAGGWTNHTGDATYNGAENSDECAWISAGSPGGAADVVMGTGTFTEQASWSNDTNSCAISHPIVDHTPGFTLDATPASASVCAGTDATFTANLTATQGYTGTVSLSASGNPANSTTGFNPSSVNTYPGSSTLTITTTGVAAGSYPVEIDGNGTGGATPHNTSVTLNVSAGAPDVPALSTPADTATGISTSASLSWQAANGAITYTVDISTDSAFINIVKSLANLTTTSTSVQGLSPNTQYYWRVTAINGCSSAVSAAFTFTTANVIAPICNSPGLAIPDANATGVNDVMTLSSSSQLTHLQLQIQATHTWVGDLKFTLSNSNGSSLVINRPGVGSGSTFGCSGNDINVTLDDTSATLVQTQCLASVPTISGTDKPANPIDTVFAGHALGDTWTLNASDNASGDTGTLNQWCLVPTVAAPTTFTVGGNVSQLTGAGLVLALNAGGPGAQTLPVSANGLFTFPTGLANSAAYAVTVGTQPAGQTCAVSNGSGTVSGANVSSIAVACTNNALVFSTQPANPLSAGTALGTIAVTEQDSLSNVITSDNSTMVDFTVPGCGGTIDLGSAQMINGVATLNSTQRFYATPNSMAVSANASAISLSVDSVTFGVNANAELLFSSNFESCQP
jgi:subtilisin-like proprotein convertase family protein